MLNHLRVARKIGSRVSPPQGPLVGILPNEVVRATRSVPFLCDNPNSQERLAPWMTNSSCSPLNLSSFQSLAKHRTARSSITRYTADDPFLSFPARTGRQPHQSGWQGIPLPASALHGATRDQMATRVKTNSGCSVTRLLVGGVGTRRGAGHTWSPYPSRGLAKVLRP